MFDEYGLRHYYVSSYAFEVLTLYGFGTGNSDGVI